MRRYTPQPKDNKTDSQWHLLVCPCIWTYEQIPQMGAAHANTAAQLCMQKAGKKIHNNSYYPRLSQQAVSASPQQKCGSDNMVWQNYWQYLLSLAVPCKQRGDKEIFDKSGKGQVVKQTFQYGRLGTLELALENKRTCTGYGHLIKIQASAVQGFRLAITPMICSPMSNAQIVEDGRLQHTLCSAWMTTALDYWSKITKRASATIFSLLGNHWL